MSGKVTDNGGHFLQMRKSVVNRKAERRRRRRRSERKRKKVFVFCGLSQQYLVRQKGSGLNDCS
jgi:hypothetical protein